ncbi:MAG: protein kinase [Polyangiaceae bacterium]|nr:protein kinase [Polyangiaceae bacterium]
MGMPQRPPATWTLGTVIGGRYRLERLLGAGGFGAVFRATDNAGQGAVAIKILSRSAMLQSDALARFYREARLAMTLGHPNTVRLLDFGDAGEGTPFIAFDLLEGTSLEQRIASGPIPLVETISIANEVLASLEEAHAKHVIHRDVKPANIFLCSAPPGAIKLLDFGVAQETPPGAAMEKLTREGMMVGTPTYMAPEQLAGKSAGPGSDFFALALVIAEMIVGAPVYQGDAFNICLSKLNGYPPPFPPGAIPPALLAVLKCATAYEITSRYQSADQMRSALMATGLSVARPSLAPQPVSGKFGTQVIERASAVLPPRSVNVMAATAPPSLNTPLAVQTGSGAGLKGTTPMITGAQSKPVSAMAATAPPSIANPMASTAPDRPRSGTKPHLAATVNDPDAAGGGLAGTINMDGPPPVSLPIKPPPPSKKPSRGSSFVVIALVVLAVLTGVAFVGYRYFLMGRAP